MCACVVLSSRFLDPPSPVRYDSGVASAVASYAPQTNRRILGIPGIVIWLKASDLLKTTRFGQAVQPTGGSGWANSLRVSGAGQAAADVNYDFIIADGTLEKWGASSLYNRGDPGAPMFRTTSAGTLEATKSSTLFSSNRLTAFLVAAQSDGSNQSQYTLHGLGGALRFSLNSSTAVFTHDDSTGVSVSVTGAVTNGPTISVAEMSTTTGTLTVYDAVSGKRQASGALAGPFAADASPSMLYSGVISPGAGLFELIVFNQSLKPTEVERIVRYLRAEYRI